MVPAERHGSRKSCMPRRRAQLSRTDKSAFLNLPYDSRFQNLFLAYIAGLTSFGLVPRATLEIPGGQRRLDRILTLIRSCRFSLHDLSRVELDRTHPPTPRFNMPFELGLAVALRHRHTWFVFESKIRRLQKSLSDLDGTDVYIHNGTVDGVFRELCNAFARNRRQPTVQEMKRIYGRLRLHLPRIMAEGGSDSPYSARVFRRLIFTAWAEQSRTAKG